MEIWLPRVVRGRCRYRNGVLFRQKKEMGSLNIQDLIEKLLIAKEKHGNIPVVIGVCYSGNYWLEPVGKLTLTTTNSIENANSEDTTVLLLEE